MLTNSNDVFVATPNDEFWFYIQNLLRGFHPYTFIRVSTVGELLEADSDASPLLAIVQASRDTATTSEWIQATKHTYPNCPLMLIHNKLSQLDFKVLRKNGADEIMQLPYDEEFISDIVLELAPVDFGGDQIPLAAMFAISLADLIPLTTLEFDLYLHLPSNQKTIILRRSGSMIDDKVIEKIQKTPGQRVYIKKADLPAFCRYSTQILKHRGELDTVSMTQKAQESKRKIFSLMSEFLDAGKPDFSQGKLIHEQALNIIKTFGLLEKKIDDETIFKKILEHSGQPRSTYNDVIAVCVFTSLFARICGEKDVESAAIAGVLHNIGLSQISQSLIYTDPDQMGRMEREIYWTHPQTAVRMVKERKVPLTPEQGLAIEQQGERIDGSGFPKHSKGEDVSRIARFLSIAIRYQHLTSLLDGQMSFKPIAAIETIIEQNKDNVRFDTMILTHLKRFMIVQTDNYRRKTADNDGDFKPAISD
jgi:HD-GYP domain-containing protein (c-di-GMP phosphodiesterase class II)